MHRPGGIHMLADPADDDPVHVPVEAVVDPSFLADAGPFGFQLHVGIDVDLFTGVAVSPLLFEFLAVVGLAAFAHGHGNAGFVLKFVFYVSCAGVVHIEEFRGHVQ